jgi:hypothetical protein
MKTQKIDLQLFFSATTYIQKFARQDLSALKDVPDEIIN